MKTFPRLAAILLCLSAGPGGLVAQELPNYRVTDIFVSSDPDLFYEVSDFNNERMVCGTWRRESTQEKGIFVWRDGEMRHISPASGNLPFVRSPESLVRMTNVLPDGTIYLVAAAIQITEDDGNGPRNIIRTIRYQINADFVVHAQPVISAISLRGLLNPHISAPYVVEENSGGGSDLDVTDEGAVFAGSRLLDTNGGFAQQWFAEGAQEAWGNLNGFDRNGSVFGNVPGEGSHYTTPLAGLTPMGGTVQIQWPVPAWANAATGLLPRALHGAYRVGIPFSDSQTGVWTDGFADEVLLPQFQFYAGITATNQRNGLTRNGDLLGYDLSNPSVLARAVAIRGAGGVYDVRTLESQLTGGYRTVAPYANPSSTNIQFEPFVLAINDHLDWVAETWTSNFPDRRGFYILRDQPGPGEIFTYSTDVFFHEDDSTGLPLVFERRLGKSGPASLRVTLAVGGTAKGGSDFTVGESRVVEWAANEQGAKTVYLPVINDAFEEGDETVRVLISEAQNATYAGDTELFASIFSNDVGNGPEPDPYAAIYAQIQAFETQIEAISRKLTAAKKIRNPKARAKKIKILKGQRLALYTRLAQFLNRL